MKLPLLLLLLTTFTACRGQTNSYTPLPVGEPVTALSNSLILVFQAADGSYWFGSDRDGLYHLEGKKMTHFSTKDGLPDNRIRSIQEDKEGTIYIATLGGISRFNGQFFTTLTPIKSNAPGENWKLQPNDLWFCMAGKNGDKGPYRYDGQNLYQLQFPKSPQEEAYLYRAPANAWSPYEVYTLFKDKRGTMWFGTGNLGVCRYDGKSFRWLYEDHLTNIPGGGSFGIRSIFEDQKGAFWICNTRQRFRILPDSIGREIRYKTEEGMKGIQTAAGADHVYFMSAVEDQKGDLWLATYADGVWRYDGKTATHYDVKGDGGKRVTLFSVYKDGQDVLWLGTHETGVYKFNGKSFERFRPEKQRTE